MRLAIWLLTGAAALAQGVGNCPGFPGCRYTPAVESTFAGQLFPLTYTDTTGFARTIEVYVRVPSTPGPLPVVVWAHGGEGVNEGGPGVMDRPSELTARAGYLTVTPAFRHRPQESRTALCEFLGIPLETVCPLLNTPAWDRPFDVKAILAALRRENEREGSALYGRADMRRVAVAGHSAGSTGTLSVAGAWREFYGRRFGGVEYFEDPAPVAFIALSPSAPGESNLFDTGFRSPRHSWDAITRPVLMLSGEGDASRQNPHGRRIAFDKLPEAGGAHVLYWFDDVDFGHAMFAEDPCDSVGKRKCDVFLEAWGAAILSYLDTYVRGDGRAREFLDNGYVTRIPGPAIGVRMLRK